MKVDISTRNHIKSIITSFYEKLISDKEMLPFFDEIVKKNALESHIEIITDFWQDILFHTHSYKNNVLQKHLDFNKKVVFEKKHFTLWLQYLSSSIDSMFEGQIAENMKNRATSIAMVMQVKFHLFKK